MIYGLHIHVGKNSCMRLVFVPHIPKFFNTYEKMKSHGRACVFITIPTSLVYPVEFSAPKIYGGFFIR